MQLTETLEELLGLFGAKIVHYSKDDFVVSTNKALPQSVMPLINGYSTSIDAPAVQILGKFDVEEFTQGKVTHEYEFDNDKKEALRALLFLATEKERYDKFCEAFDQEVEEELDSQEQ